MIGCSDSNNTLSDTILLGVALFFCSAAGFGSALLYSINIGVLFFVLLWRTIKLNEIIKAIVVFFSLIVCLLEPATTSLTSFLSLLLLSQGFTRASISFLFSQIPYHLSQFFNLPVFALHPVLVGLVFTISYVTFYNSDNRVVNFFLYKVPILSYGLLLLISQFVVWPIEKPKETKAPPGYRIGNTVERIIGRNLQPTALLSYGNDKQEVTYNSTVYLDHDAPQEVSNANYRQPRPWGNNTLIGPEHLLFAVKRDSVYIFNLGARIRPELGSKILSFYDSGEVVPIIIQKNKKLIFADSDMLTDRLASYQHNLITAIAGTDLMTRSFFIASALMLLLTCFTKKNILFCVLFLGTYILFLHLEKKSGSVRYVGRDLKWAHSDLGYGLVRALQDQDVMVTHGKKNSIILVVASKSTAVLSSERYVVLEPLAEVTIGNHLLKSLDLPLGTKDGVVDARNILFDNKVCGPKITLGTNITVYATGTPSALDFSHVIIQDRRP